MVMNKFLINCVSNNKLDGQTSLYDYFYFRLKTEFFYYDNTFFTLHIFYSPVCRLYPNREKM